MIVDVIVPSYTTPKLSTMVSNMIASLRASESIQFNIVIVESNQVTDLGQDSTLKFPEGPFNYNKALNIGAKSCSGDWIVFANNDLLFHPGWLSRILEIYEATDIRSFSPWDLRHGLHHKEVRPYYEGYRIGYPGEVAGWCIVLPRSVYESIELREHVTFYYSDDVYADELREKGIKHALVRDSRVDHLESVTWVKSGEFSNKDKQDMSVGQTKAYLEGKKREHRSDK